MLFSPANPIVPPLAAGLPVAPHCGVHMGLVFPAGVVPVPQPAVAGLAALPPQPGAAGLADLPDQPAGGAAAAHPGLPL